MRLLHIDQSGTLISTDFRGKTKPPYAILSHRWGDPDSEVVFEDITRKKYQERANYGKLQFCATQAAKDNLQYFWVDTCCIDKWNLSELSRSINSMFRYYREAARCYVFLPDVFVPAAPGKSVPPAPETLHRSDWEPAFRASQWFTRGWTLQELIAPVTVDFFSCNRQWLGDKSSLEDVLHEITRVPLSALRNCALEEFSVSERMQWAEHRRTTEQEDSVYCLLGLLGVSLSTAYGEGKENAIKRLQDEVESTMRAPAILPFLRNQRFVGRESQLAQLKRRLFTDEQHTTALAIVGPTGAGKSQVALELAYQEREKNVNCSVFWIDASGIDRINTSFESVARKLEIPGFDDATGDVKQLVKLHIEAEENKQYLLIFDNTEETTSRDHTANLLEFLPQSKLCSVVFTTADMDLARSLGVQHSIQLQELSSDTAQMMLENHLDTPISGTEQEEAKGLLQELSYLPLAISQAAAYINTRGTTLGGYRAQLQYEKNRFSKLPGGAIDKQNLQSPVAATLFVALSHIVQTNELATNLVCLAACMDRHDILLDLLQAPSPREREDAVKLLSRFEVVTRRPGDSALDLHRLVHLTLQEYLRGLGCVTGFTHGAIKQVLQLFPDEDPNNRSRWRRLLPHAKRALSYHCGEEDDENSLLLKLKCAVALSSDGRYNEAEYMFKQAMEAVRIFGEESPATMAVMSNLASLYRKQGRWEEAEQIQVKDLEMCTRAHGDEHASTIHSRSNLALIFCNQGRFKEAEGLQAELLEITSRMFGEEHNSTMTTMGNLATTYRYQGRWEEAEKLQERELEICSRVHGHEHMSTLNSKVNLALILSSQGRLKESEDLGVQVMEASLRALGTEHPFTLTSMSNLAMTYEKQGRWKEAEELQAKELAITRKVLGEDHPDTITSIANLASIICHDEGRLKEAEELEVEVLRLRKEVQGERHPDTLMAMHNLAVTYKSSGRDEEALSLIAACFQLCKEVLGKEHHQTQAARSTIRKWKIGRMKVNESYCLCM